MTKERSDFWTKVGMTTFILCICAFVTLSSYVYYNNNASVEVRIKSDELIKRETAVANEALTKTLQLTSDSLATYKSTTQKRDSLYINKIKMYENKLVQMQQENDSLHTVLRSLKQSDIQPIVRGKLN